VGLWGRRFLLGAGAGTGSSSDSVSSSGSGSSGWIELPARRRIDRVKLELAIN